MVQNQLMNTHKYVQFHTYGTQSYTTSYTWQSDSYCVGVAPGPNVLEMDALSDLVAMATGGVNNLTQNMAYSGGLRF